ncbi:LIM and calponin homology domains-containing protein 1a [Centropristis striata]|uniref:LIM and calponin homology domains-containing protein 1a n=1 Tax=Centropristis striata TaxID=184440 RepID=UPI0027DFDF2B|nr:LIM and calponin homology domains-containing protein 1a [Centropristis striata]
MASPAAGRDDPNASSPRDEQEQPGSNHPEPACLEAQKWIEAVTGKSFGDKDFRSGLENGILLCELLSAIKPGLVKKINRLPTPIAGLDNLSVFLRGCEELGLKGSQLFDPGDLQDTSIRANLKDSDCNRKLKNVLNTVFWLGKAASGCASYSGPTLNLKEFEGLLAQMKMETEEGGDSSQKRSVRDSGYDCWDSERSDSLSPPRHTRDNSLDSLDSFGSRSQHSPSPDVVNRGNSDGRGSDSEADAPSRRPDVRKDDMLARRTASSESRSSIPFNQFLPNRTNASSYIPTPRRKPHSEEGEQRRSVSLGDMLNEEEVGHLPPLSQSRHERMHEQYNNFQEDDDHWQNNLAAWKNRRRSASQELIKKEEERKRMEKRMKEERSESNKRKSIKTYKEIVEEKERREIELCNAYRNAATPEEAAMVLQRYALRFTISDATLDSLKLPRSTSKPKQDPNLVDKEAKTTPPVNQTSQPPHKPEPAVITNQQHTEPEEMETETTAEQETSPSVSSSSPTPVSPLSPTTNSENVPPQSLEVNEPQSKPTESPTTPQKQAPTGEAKPQTKPSPPQIAQVQPHTTQPVHTLPSPPSVVPRPVPLLAAKPYCQPRSTQSGHKSVKMDGLVRVNGEVTEDLSTSTSTTSVQHLTPEVKDVQSEQTEIDVPSKQTEKDLSSKQTEKNVPSKPTEIELPSKEAEKDLPSQKTETEFPTETTTIYQETVQQTAPPQTERSSLGSAISSLIGGRNCTITTTIVTELTHVEPHQPDIQSNGQVNGTSGFSGSPAEEEKTPSVSSPNSMSEYSPTVTEGLEESSVSVSISQQLQLVLFFSVSLHSIETPMLNLAKRVNHWVWDPNEERKRLESWQQEQERLLQEQYQREQEKLKKEWEKAQLEVAEEERKHNEEERKILEETVTPLNPTGLLNHQPVETGTTSSAPENDKNSVPQQQNGQRPSVGNEDQHASKLHFFQDSSCDGAASKKQELWKTASLDRNPQLNQPHIVKRSESHDAVTNKQQTSPSSPQPPSPSRCVSGKRLCSGCSQPLGKGAAMIIDTLGLFFHVQCFKCGVCTGQLGDATAGTDVRIRNGLLSCHECYIASRGRGQPTTL